MLLSLLDAFFSKLVFMLLVCCDDSVENVIVSNGHCNKLAQM